MNIKNRKIGNKKEIYIDVKTNKDEYVKSIIYFYIHIYIYIFFFLGKKKGINNK